MNLISFYDSIKNPITDEKVLNNIIAAYFNKKNNFYTSLVRIQKKISQSQIIINMILIFFIQQCLMNGKKIM